MDDFNNDRISIYDLELYGLESNMKEFNEENLNKIAELIYYFTVNYNSLEKADKFYLIEGIEDYLNEDISFHINDKKINFELTLCKIHRENETLLYDLKIYVNDFLENEKKTEFQKNLEKKIGINSNGLFKKDSKEKNLNRLLKQISTIYKSNSVKYKRI
jgi:hypothetical protein